MVLFHCKSIRSINNKETSTYHVFVTDQEIELQHIQTFEMITLLSSFFPNRDRTIDSLPLTATLEYVGTTFTKEISDQIN